MAEDRRRRWDRIHSAPPPGYEPRNGVPPTPHEQRRMHELRAQGLTVEQIAVELRTLSYWAVKHHLRGVPRGTPSGPGAG